MKQLLIAMLFFTTPALAGEIPPALSSKAELIVDVLVEEVLYIGLFEGQLLHKAKVKVVATKKGKPPAKLLVLLNNPAELEPGAKLTLRELCPGENSRLALTKAGVAQGEYLIVGAVGAGGRQILKPSSTAFPGPRPHRRQTLPPGYDPAANATFLKLLDLSFALVVFSLCMTGAWRIMANRNSPTTKDSEPSSELPPAADKTTTKQSQQ